MAITDTSQYVDAADRASELSMKLHALLCNTYGEAGESFRGLNDELQDWYMWACSDMAQELAAVVKEMVLASISVEGG